MTIFESCGTASKASFNGNEINFMKRTKFL